MVRAIVLCCLTVLVASFIVSTDALSIRTKTENTDVKKTENEVSSTPEQKIEDQIDESMKTLKEKVSALSALNKENEEAFIKMQEKVAEMDQKVKDMLARLKKINTADHLNAGAEEIEKL